MALTRKNLELSVLSADFLSAEQKVSILNILKQKAEEPAKPATSILRFDRSEYIRLAKKVLESHDQEALASLVKIERETGKYILPFPLKKGFWSAVRKGQLFDFSRAPHLLKEFEKNLESLA